MAGIRREFMKEYCSRNGCFTSSRNEYESWDVSERTIREILATAASENGWRFEESHGKHETGLDVLGFMAVGDNDYLVARVIGYGHYGGSSVVVFDREGNAAGPDAEDIRKAIHAPIRQALDDAEREALGYYGLEEWPDSDP